MLTNVPGQKVFSKVNEKWKIKILIFLSIAFTFRRFSLIWASSSHYKHKLPCSFFFCLFVLNELIWPLLKLPILIVLFVLENWLEILCFNTKICFFLCFIFLVIIKNWCHRGALVSTIASQPEGSWFWPVLCEACSPCVGFLWVLQFSLTVHRHAGYLVTLNWP